ncbi:hypothetical protein [Streptomyces sp. MST-110588]|uniref:hypothetical protein n=1 Tax=Streptomyces sp. MST-110588 TaxID=2833628 RepID=UPI001F5DB7CE|nr:hypothetical protein [Streptomyces sp. MST-110588]UNO43506.1 hypothetical protein KGS77_33555 [Streptomyces sp. MST-110588]
MADEVIDKFLELLSPENRAWVAGLPAARQRLYATRHLELMNGDRTSGHLRSHDILNPDAQGMVLGDLQDPGKLADAMVRQERERTE